jgi:hypothetical protein
LKDAAETFWKLKKNPVDVESLDGVNGANGLELTNHVDQKDKLKPAQELVLKHKVIATFTLPLINTLLSCQTDTTEPESTLLSTVNAPTNVTNASVNQFDNNC